MVYQLGNLLCFRPCDNPYLRACQIGDVKKVEETIDEEISFKDANKWTGLHFASANGHLPVVEYLTSKGIEINEKTDQGTSALDLAYKNGHLEICKFLGSKKCNVTIQTVTNAETDGHEVIVNLLKPLM